MDTIIKITYTNYTENVVATTENIEQIISIVRNDETCESIEIVQQGTFVFENKFTPKKVNNAGKKAIELEFQIASVQEALENGEDKFLSNVWSRKEWEACQKKLETLEGKLEKLISDRLTNNAFNNYVASQACCYWDEYKSF